MTVHNTTMHKGTGLMVEPFGTDGAMRLVPLHETTPGRAFILDAEAMDTLRRYLAPDVD